jgi:hypothetical protein
LIEGLPAVLYALLNVKMIVDVKLFPGMVRVADGVIVRLPVLLLPVQNVPPRLALCKVKVLPFGPPVGFQATWTLETVIESWGLVIVILIVLPDIVIAP